MDRMWTVIAAVAAFIITALLGKWLVPFLRKLNFGQTIREIGPKWHQSKQGTPVMGGLMFIIGSVITICGVSSAYFIYSYGGLNFSQSAQMQQQIQIVTGILMAALFGAIGFVDDYIKVVKKRNLGLTGTQKLIFQFIVAGGYLVAQYFFGKGTDTIIPFIGNVDIGIFYWIISIFLIVGLVNAVNLTDGVDGLLGSVTFFFALFFMLIAGLMQSMGAAISAAALAGACLGFLMWNFHPAKVFMGDTGSLFLGGAVCALAFSVRMPILLLPLGLVYLMEMFSVILQVLYFKATKGKRLFKMSPIHHHFELKGWSEIKVTVVFSMITVVMGIASFLIVLFGGHYKL